MSNFFTFNGQSSKDFGITLSKMPSYTTPAPIYQTYNIPGRNGALHMLTGAYESVIATYSMWFTGGAAEAAAIKSWLAGAPLSCELADTYAPETYRIANAIYSADWENTLGIHGEGTIEFECHPQQYLRQGDYVVTYTENGSIYNPEAFNALPQIRIYGTGTLTVNGYSCEINDVDEYLDIDSETMLAYKDGLSCDANVYIPTYPKLSPGKNNIAIEGDITKIEIKPRWWRL